jgi:hypothetical protein
LPEEVELRSPAADCRPWLRLPEPARDRLDPVCWLPERRWVDEDFRVMM